jgi:hypothetical protein
MMKANKEEGCRYSSVEAEVVPHHPVPYISCFASIVLISNGPELAYLSRITHIKSGLY